MAQPLDRETLTSRVVLTPAEAASVLQISRATLYRRVASGDIPVVAGLGGAVRIPARRLLELIEGQAAVAPLRRSR